MKKEYQDKIDEYLLHRMSDDERKEFEKDADDDKELQEQLEFTENVQQVMKSRNEKLSKMKGWENDHTRREDVQATSAIKHKSRLRIIYWFSGVAAFFIVGVFVFTTYRLPENNSFYDRYSHNSKNKVLYERGNDENLAAIKLIEERDDNQMLAMLEKNEERINLKIMLLNRDKYSRGDSQFAVEEELNVQYDSLLSLKWAKVPILIRLKRYEEAMRLLDEIRHSKSKYKERADSLYRLQEQ